MGNNNNYNKTQIKITLCIHQIEFLTDKLMTKMIN